MEERSDDGGISGPPDAGLHRLGSGAVTHYTMLELADRFKLMNLAFDQEDYRVDNNLEIINSPVEKDS